MNKWYLLAVMFFLLSCELQELEDWALECGQNQLLCDRRSSAMPRQNERLCGETDDLEIKLFIARDIECNFHVDWGDGSKQHITECNDDTLKHRYGNVGVYRVKINGKYGEWSYENIPGNNSGKRKNIASKLTGVLSFGTAMSPMSLICRRCLVGHQASIKISEDGISPAFGACQACLIGHLHSIKISEDGMSPTSLIRRSKFISAPGIQYICS